MSTNQNQQGGVRLESPLVELDFTSINQDPSLVSLHEQPFLGHLNVRGSLANSAFASACKKVLGQALPADANRVVVGNNATIIWYGPSEWLVLVAGESTAQTVKALQQELGETHSLITDISGGNTVIEIGGSHARALLAKAVTIDLHPSVFAVGHAALTTFAHAAATLYCPQENVYRIIVRRSFADYIGHWLIDAAQQFITTS